jgi:hypothetical protein
MFLLRQVLLRRACAHSSSVPVAVYRWSVLEIQLNSGFGCGELRIDGNEICVVFKDTINRTRVSCSTFRMENQLLKAVECEV